MTIIGYKDFGIKKLHFTSRSYTLLIPSEWIYAEFDSEAISQHILKVQITVERDELIIKPIDAQKKKVIEK